MQVFDTNETSSGIDPELINEFLQANQVFIQNSINSGLLSNEVINLFKNSIDVSIPVVIPQPFSHKTSSFRQSMDIDKLL